MGARRVHVALSVFGLLERRTAKYEKPGSVLSSQSRTTLVPLALAVTFVGAAAAAEEQQTSSAATAAPMAYGRKGFPLMGAVRA